jgi:hypothetical protein
MSTPGHRRPQSRTPIGRSVVATFAVALLLIGVVALVPHIGPLRAVTSHGVGGAAPGPAPIALTHDAATATRPTTPFASRWVRILDLLDGRRAMAWRTGRPSELSGVFVPGSPELAEDRRALRGYVDRGLVVRSVREGYDVEAVERRDPSTVVLLVVDRLEAAYAVAGSGATEALPVDRPTRHHIVLRRLGGRWLIARITLA